MSVSVEQLENFIVKAQPDLETIKRELNAFNIFNVLGVQYREIRHSNFLGWLFDPNESHNLDDVFLKDLFKLIREVCDFISSEKLVSLLLEDLSQTIVHRESEHNIDILIVNEALDILICIENKIYADYSRHQLSKYYQYIEENYQEITNRIYLTLTPSESHNHLGFEDGDKYQNINYNQIIDLIKGNKGVINKALPTVKESINQYITMTEKNITFSSKEIKLAQEIYNKYKDEINFIVKIKSDFKGFKDTLWDYIKEGHLEGYLLSHELKTSAIVRILPNNEEIKSLFTKPEFKSWGEDYFFCLEIFVEKSEVWMKWVFGNIGDREQEKELQGVKTKWYETMKSFDSLKHKDVKIYNSKPTSNYPGVCWVKFFNEDDFINEGISVLDLFKKRFEEVHYEIIEPWQKECLQKLTVLK